MRSESATNVEPMSLEQFERLPDEDPDRLELARGCLVREPPPGARHGDIAYRMSRKLGNFLEGTDIGRVAIGAGFLLAEDPPTVRGPDIAVVSRESVPPEGPPDGYWRVAPVLAVEVVSPSNTITGMQEKVFDYLDAGTREVWVVDPTTEMVTIHRSRRDVRTLAQEDRLVGGDFLPGFELVLGDLFAAT